MVTEVLTAHQLKKEAPVFGQWSFNDHEQIVFCHDKDTGLKAIIGVHNTILGPALGGTRMYDYKTEWDALNDVLRLSRGMTYKAAITGLNLGGGKAVIIGDPKKIKTPELMKRFGKFVHTLGGKYYTAEDVGMETSDMDTVREVTPYVTGISESKGGAGNPSPVTAYGVYMGMKASAQFAYGNDNLEGKRICVQGIGHVGEELVRLISEEGANVLISDINEERLHQVSTMYNAEIYRGKDLYAEMMDIYAPCALGATINDETIHKLKAKVIAGAANNQLADENTHGILLQEKEIVYAPDFLINAGGIINVFAEIEGYGREQIINKTENIYNTTLDILNKAKATGMTTNAAANSIAEERIATKKSIIDL
ncbi:Glu/Leu/Phe/Val dehydrogenase dimerization domain-containing protein [Aquimarina sp. RZ0]|uniref:Glu/Leu/Phe/Val dehydrogenase dimerization domain-containing protein n=1 Tax=Aquimarina sp. RZ0 TaxID=2607730 RepID=UPI0011F2F7AA|nr:Glu/Leu/Phe/Val dehydrogenase dimerization domain-containing protein [Aquimarina sp. RZ0]KAA1243151.1 Glu/Leu/Phe/Val dehydrogenase [Aquimarina sp. RZ0]